KNDLFQPELDALDGYIGRGGKALIMVDPFQNEGLRKYLLKYGFVLDNDLVVESNPLGRLFGIGPEVPIVQQYGTHAITREMGGVSTLFPLTRSMSMVTPLPKGVSWDPLARTSEQSWGETNREELQRGVAKPDPADPKGPLTAAVVAVVLLALGAFYYVYEIKGGPARAKVEAQKGRLWTVDAGDVTEVELKRSGEVVKLKREADGWQILEPVTARGDRAKVDE